LKPSYDVVVVGGGIVGLSCAAAASRAGLKVAVVERGRAGREASWAAAGVLTPIHLADYPEPLANLAAFSLGLYPDFVEGAREASGIDPEFAPSGALMVELDEEDEGRGRKLLAWKKKNNQPAERLSAREARSIEPALSARVRGAVLLPDVGQVRNNRLCRALVLALRRAGVDLLEESPCAEAGRGIVRIPGRRLEAGRVVIATGAWTAELAQAPVRPVRGQMLLAEGPPGFLLHIVIHKDQYLVPRLDGRILAGSTMEEAGFDKRVTMRGVEFLARRAAEICPAVSGLSWAGAWAGLRPGVADRIPYIAPLPSDARTIVASGHFRNGILLAPATASMVVSMILGTPSPVDPAPFGFRSRPAAGAGRRPRRGYRRTGNASGP
jgi:glycine oxidase